MTPQDIADFWQRLVEGQRMTQVELEEMAEAMADYSEAITKSKNKTKKAYDDEVDTIDEVVKAMDKQRDSTRALTRAYSSVISGVKDAGNTFVQSFNQNGGSLTGVFKSITTVGSGLGDATSEILGKFSKLAFPLKIFTGLVAGAAGAVGFLLGQIDAMVDATREASSAGATFGGSMLDLKVAANDAGMAIQEFAGFIKNNNERMVAFGSSVSSGAKSVSRLTGSIIDSGMLDQFMALGMNLSDVNEASLQMLELQARQRRLAYFEGLTREQQAQQTLEYVRSLKVLNELTGMSVEEQKRERDRMRAIAGFRQMLDRMTPRMAANFESAAVLFDKVNKDVGQTFREFAQEGRPLNEATNLLTQRFPHMAETIQRTIGMINEGGENLNVEQFNIKVAQILSTMRQGFEEDRKLNRDFMRVSAFEAADPLVSRMGEVGVSVSDFAIRVQSMDEALQVVSDITGNMDELDKTTRAAQASLAEMMKMFRTFLNDVLASGEFQSLLVSLRKALEKLVPFLTGTFIPFLDRTFGSLTENKPREARRFRPFPPAADYIERVYTTPDPMFHEELRKRLEEGSARGNILTGPESGYTATLHGTEAVIPLPDNRNIPVKINELDSLKTSIDSLSDRLSEMSMNNKQSQRTEKETMFSEDQKVDMMITKLSEATETLKGILKEQKNTSGIISDTRFS